LTINDKVGLKVSIYKLAMEEIWHKLQIKILRKKITNWFLVDINMPTEALHSLIACDSWNWPKMFLPLLYYLLFQSIRTIVCCFFFLLHKNLRKFKNVNLEYRLVRLGWLSS